MRALLILACTLSICLPSFAQSAASDSSQTQSTTPTSSGVRIHVRHDNRTRRIYIIHPSPATSATPPPSASSPTDIVPPPPPLAPSVTPADLRQLEARLLSQFQQMIAQLQSVSQPDTTQSESSSLDSLYVPPPISSSPSPEISYALLELALQIDSLKQILKRLKTAPAPMEAPPAPDTTQEAQIRAIECSLYETGLFRSARIIFETNKASLLPIAHEVLNIVGQVLVRNPALHIEIAGHTDSTGPATYNLKLSQKRAETVRQYLLTHFPTLQAERLVAKGYGESQPIAPNNTPTGRTLNRRVEFRVLSGNTP